MRAMTTPSAPAGRPADLTQAQRLLVVGAQSLAAAVGAFYGFRFGVQVAGPWLGAIAGVNTAFFAALFTSSAADWILRRKA